MGCNGHPSRPSMGRTGPEMLENTGGGVARFKYFLQYYPSIVPCLYTQGLLHTLPLP